MARDFKVNGVSVGVLSDWYGLDVINARSTFDFTIYDLNGISLDNGDTVEIYHDAVKIFGGLVNTINKYEELPGQLYYTVNAVDYSALADRRLIADSIENQTAGYIVTNHILPILSEEGVTAGDIQNGIVVEKAVFNYVKASQALDQLKTLSGFNWNIDKDRKLNFFDNATNLSSITVTDTFNHSGFNQYQSLLQYRNTQYIRGGKGTTATQTKEKPTPEPDGISKKFILRYPVAEKPKIFVNTIEINQDDIGINGVDDNKKWYWNADKEIIVQDDSETTLIASDVLEIDYKGYFNLLGFSQNPAQIDQRKALESGTSGIYESLTKEPSIDTSNAASQFAEGLLLKYGEIEDKISFSTEIPGIESGQLLAVQKSLYGINDSFLIESVGMSAVGDGIQYEISALDGASLGGWEEFFKELISSGGQFNISANEVVILLNSVIEIDKNKGNIIIQAVDPLICSETTIISDTLLLGTITSEVTVND